MTPLSGETSLTRVLDAQAAAQPDAPAFVAEGQRPLTYRALADLAEQMRRSLNAWGYGRGDRIAIVHPGGGAAMAAALVGVTSTASAVPLNPDYTAGEFGFYLNDVGVSALVAPEGVETPARVAAERLGIPVLDLRPADPEVAGSVVLVGGSPAEARQPGAATPDDEMLVLYTSGTTSRAKIVPARHRHMFARAAGMVRNFDLTPRDRCLNLMPLFHGHGLYNGLITQLLAGSSVAFLTRFSAEAFFGQLETLQPTWYTAGYTFHHAILTGAPSYSKAIAGARMRFIRSGSGRLEPAVAKALEDHFGVPVLETYATSETGVMAGNPMPPAQHKHGSVGVSIIGDIVLMDAAGNVVPQGGRGEVVVRGPHVFDGYENDPKANAAAFTDGWFRTGDEGEFDADGYLRLTGRIKELINRGGEKITPIEVDTALLSHPDITAAATFAIPHPTLGQEVAAVVVPAQGAVLTDQQVMQFARRHLAAFKVPRRILLVEEIPKGPGGKIQRNLLAEALGLNAAAVQAPAAPADRPATPLETIVTRLWAETLGLDKVGLHDDFFLLGGDSLSAVELFLKIEKELGRRLPRAVLFEAGTVSEMARRIEEDAASTCIVPIQPKGDAPPFFCVHDGDGHVLNFRDLARHLGEGQAFYGIQVMGLDGSAVPFTRIDDMAAQYVGEIRKVQPSGPYHIGGYSFGGRVAYVMAQQLRAAGEEVALLALLDTYCHVGRRRIGLRQWVGRHWARLAALSPAEMPAYAGLRLRNIMVMTTMAVRLRLFSAAWRFCEWRNRPIPRFMWRPAEANLMIRARYRARPYDGSAVLFKAELYAGTHPDAHAGWQALVRGGLQVRPISGRHFEIVKEPHVRVLARQLVDCLAEARDDHDPAEILASQPRRRDAAG